MEGLLPLFAADPFGNGLLTVQRLLPVVDGSSGNGQLTVCHYSHQLTVCPPMLVCRVQSETAGTVTRHLPSSMSPMLIPTVQSGRGGKNPLAHPGAVLRRQSQPVPRKMAVQLVGRLSLFQGEVTYTQSVPI